MCPTTSHHERRSDKLWRCYVVAEDQLARRTVDIIWRGNHCRYTSKRLLDAGHGLSAPEAPTSSHLQPSICQQCGPSATEANQLDQKLATHRRLMLQVCAYARAVNAIHTSMCDVRMRSHCASGDPTGEPPGTASEPPATRQGTVNNDSVS